MQRSLGLALTLIWLAAATAGQRPPASIYPGRCETPASQRTSDAGCYLDAEVEMEEISEPVFWHLYTYPTMPAAEKARSKNGTPVEVFGKFWVFTLAGEGWRASSGDRVAVIGPLPIRPGTKYKARYIESTLPPGIVSAAHTHPGPEAFYTLSGSQCLETSAGVTISHAGESTIVPEGPSMAVNAFGKENRRGIAIVLHKSTRPWMAMSSWRPSGRCPR